MQGSSDDINGVDMRNTIRFLLFIIILAGHAQLFAFSSRAIDPLILPTWHQDSPWNARCPGEGQNRANAGSHALALAKIMKYWEYPTHGLGSVSYDDDDYGQISQDFSGEINWSGMSNSMVLLTTQRYIFMCGASVYTDYEVQNSSSTLLGILNSLETYFQYDPGMQIMNKEQNSATFWIETLHTELNASRPVVYTITLDNGREVACIIDGYNDSGQFHIDWSEASISNSWVYLDNLSYESEIINDANQSMLVGIRPIDLEVVPYPAQVPSPVNSAINVAIGTNLSWAAGGGIVNGYKVYLGTDNPPTNIVNGTTQTTTTYDPADFSYNTQYFWKIVPYNQSGDAIDCPIWTFSTLLGQIEISTPVFSPPGGLYSNAITVSINPTTVPAGAAIRYTLDGSDPNESSTIYGSPLQVLAGQIVTIRARAYLNGWAPSEIYTANYSTINSWIGTPILAISMSGRSAVLSWPVCAGATSYRIEYAYDPYGTYSVLSTTSSLSYTHTNIGNSQTKVFYRVIAVSGRTESAPSEVVGYFKQHCVSGLNMIALPMEIPWSWVSELGSEYQSSVESIYYWDAAVQTWVGATDLGGCWDGDFAIHTNDVLFVSNTSVIDLFFCGTLPAPQAQYSLVPGLNTIMIPLNISSMSMASDLDMDSGLIDFVCQWNNVYQAYDVAVNYGGFWDEDFEIGIGVPLLIYSNYSITWPTRSMDTKRPTDFR